VYPQAGDVKNGFTLKRTTLPCDKSITARKGIARASADTTG
jgi:hypothetical protein